MFTQTQQQEFAEFCKRNGIRFVNLQEYQAAIQQYFSEE